MNYRNENATPRDRYDSHAFSSSCSRRTGGCREGEYNTCKMPRTSYGPYTKGKKCGRDSNGFLKRETPIAMVYSPVQEWKELYDPHTALTNGTIFKELDLPFYPTPCRRKECSPCQYR